MQQQYYDYNKHEWEVENIEAHRIKTVKNPKNSSYELRKEYLLKWKGFTLPTWEPEENLQNCKDLLKDYLKKINGSENIDNNDYEFNKDDNKINLKEEEEEEEKTISTAVSKNMNKSKKNKLKKNNKKKDIFKILDVIGVKFPNKKGEDFIYKIKFRYKGKISAKMATNDNGIIPNNILVKFYEKLFSKVHQGQYLGC